MARLFNLIGYWDGDSYLESESHKYFIAGYNTLNLRENHAVKFSAIVGDSPSSGHCVFCLGHAPQEFRNIVSWGIGEDSGLENNQAVIALESGKRIIFDIKD